MPPKKKKATAARNRATRLNARSRYRLAGQIFSRLMYPVGDYRKMFPRDDKEFRHLKTNNVFQRVSTQLDVADYTYEAVELTVGRPRSKMLGKGKLRNPTRMKTGSDGQFAFDNPAPQLSYGKTYELRAVLRFIGESSSRKLESKVPFAYERLAVRFNVPKSKAALVDQPSKIKVIVGHWIGLPVKRVDRRTRKVKWGLMFQGTPMEKETVRPVFDQSDQTDNTLWFGGPAALVFNTFALQVPHITYKEEAPIRNVTLRLGDDNWTIPVDNRNVSGAACVAMVLRYYGAKVTLDDVVKQTGVEFVKANTNGIRKALPQGHFKKRFLRLSDADQRYTYNVRKYLVAAAESLCDKHFKEFWWSKYDQKCRIVWRDSSPSSDTWEDTRRMLARGWPIIAKNIGRMMVITGARVNSKGKYRNIYVNDPHDMYKVTEAFDKQQLIIARDLPQRAISGGKPERLREGGQVPAPRREFQPGLAARNKASA